MVIPVQRRKEVISDIAALFSDIAGKKKTENSYQKKAQNWPKKRIIP